MIAKFLFKKLIKPNISSFLFARTIRKVQPQPIKPDVEVEQVTEQERILLNKQHGRQLRQKKIFSNRSRKERQQDEKLEKDILKLMKQGKSDQQILRIMSNNNKNPKQQSNQQQTSGYINFEQIINKQNESEQMLIARQQALIDQMKKHSNVRQQKINKALYYSKKQEDSQIEFNIKKERLIQQIRSNSTQQNLKQITTTQLTEYRIPKNLRQSVNQFKNNQMRYFHELIHRPQQTGTKMNKRSSKMQNGAVNQIINKKKQEKLQQYSPIQLKKEIKYQLQQESLEQKKQRKMVLYQQQQNPTPEDVQFIQKGKKDLQLVNKNISSIFLSEKQKHHIYKMEYKQSSFGKQEERINNVLMQLKELGINAQLSDIKQMDKQFIFNEKLRLQKLEQFNKYQQRKEKLKKIKQIRAKIHQVPYHDRLDYLKFDSIQGFNGKKHKLSTGFPDTSKLNEINEKYARSVFKSQNDWDYQYLRTIQNMQSWIYFQIYNKNKQSLGIFNNIDITNIIPNNSLTVLNLIWEKKSIGNTQDPKYAKIQQNQEQIKNFNQNLNKYSQYLSGKMCQQLCLKFGPDIRFHHFKQSQQLADAKSMLVHDMPGIIKTKLKQQYQKGKLPSKMKVEQFNNLIKEIQDNYIQKVQKLDNPDKMINQKKRKIKSENIKQRNNRTQDGKRKKSQKKAHRSQQFWNQL